MSMAKDYLEYLQDKLHRSYFENCSLRYLYLNRQQLQRLDESDMPCIHYHHSICGSQDCDSIVKWIRSTIQKRFSESDFSTVPGEVQHIYDQIKKDFIRKCSSAHDANFNTHFEMEVLELQPGVEYRSFKPCFEHNRVFGTYYVSVSGGAGHQGMPVINNSVCAIDIGCYALLLDGVEMVSHILVRPEHNIAFLTFTFSFDRNVIFENVDNTPLHKCTSDELIHRIQSEQTVTMRLKRLLGHNDITLLEQSALLNTYEAKALCKRLPCNNIQSDKKLVQMLHHIVANTGERQVHETQTGFFSFKKQILLDSKEIEDIFTAMYGIGRLIGCAVVRVKDNGFFMDRTSPGVLLHVVVSKPVHGGYLYMDKQFYDVNALDVFCLSRCGLYAYSTVRGATDLSILEFQFEPSVS